MKELDPMTPANIKKRAGDAAARAIGRTVADPLLFWLIWSVCGFGRRYFGFLPPQFTNVGLLGILGLFIVIRILKRLILPLGKLP